MALSLNRRTFLALAGSGLLVPAPRVHAASLSERKFLFLHCEGGWDILKVFAPLFGVAGVQMDGTASLGTAGGLPFVHDDARPSVATFFERYADRCCILNGMEVQSVTHERCRRILLTGSGESGRDDWPSFIAARSTICDLLPHLVMSGTAYTNQHSASVVRVGDNGQLPSLIDGSALSSGMSAELSSLSDEWVRQRAAAHAAAAPDDRTARFASSYSDMLDKLVSLEQASGLSLDTEPEGCNRHIANDAAVVLTCMEQGLTRCGMIRSEGVCNFGWDTHSDNDLQDRHYDAFFGYLSAIMADLDSRTSLSGAPLSEEVTIVVVSEMGRHPQINASQGRDHWTYTSAMLIGSGINGGLVIGAMDENFHGMPVNLSTGELTASGTTLTPGNLGATLLALADIDPAEHTDDGPIEVVLA